MRNQLDPRIIRPAPGLRTIAAAAVVATCLGISSAKADQLITGSSNAFEVSSTLQLSLSGVNLADGTIAPTTTASGTSPGVYNTTSSLANVNLSAGTGSFAGSLVSVGNGVSGSGGTAFTSTVSSNIAAGSTTGNAQAMATANNLSLGVLKLLTTPVIGLTAGTVTSTSSVTGTYGHLVAAGSSTLTGASLSILNVPFNLSALTPGVMVPTSITGLTIGTNINTITGNGISTETITNDALVLTFTNVASGLLGALGVSEVLNGQIIIGQSTSTLNATPAPEPASALMVGLGLGLAGIGARRRLKRRDLQPVAQSSPPPG